MSLTTIPLEKSTRDKLKEFANKSESWNDLLERLYETARQTQQAQAFFSQETLSTQELLERIDTW
jgi:hypothetical protein